LNKTFPIQIAFRHLSHRTKTHSHTGISLPTKDHSTTRQGTIFRSISTNRSAYQNICRLASPISKRPKSL